MSDHNQNTRGLKTLKSYLIGLVLSLILTLIAFGVVAHQAITSKSELIACIMILAVLQLIVQVTCFLRLNASREGRWELMPFLFALFVVLVVVLGSMWIMFNLNYNMMN